MIVKNIAHGTWHKDITTIAKVYFLFKANETKLSLEKRVGLFNN